MTDDSVESGKLVGEEAVVPIEDITQLQVGFKVHVFENKEQKYVEAEILYKKMKKNMLIFYVHFKNYNKRLDEWVSLERIDLSKGVILPKPKAESSDGKKKSSTPMTPLTPMIIKKFDPLAAADSALKGNTDEMDLDSLDVQGLKKNDNMSRNDEILKLRHSGSMIQNKSEIAKVRNINKINIGQHIVEPWYFSPYPEELTECDEIYICDFSLEYFGSKKQFERFRKKSTMRCPPGNEIYRDSKVSFFEIDGKKQRTWCRNLCLLSKLFLDHKTLYYDVDPFLFYVMTYRDELGQHVVGYFSKEKESAEGYNVACILTLPCYQRNGFGKLLIQFSYELSKKEHKSGSPEKPLSDLGLISYRSYWYDTIVRLLVENNFKSITIDEISNLTSMTTTDILHTLQNSNVLRYYKGQHVIVLTDDCIKLYEKLKKKNAHQLNAEYLQWVPPVFTASQLRFGW